MRNIRVLLLLFIYMIRCLSVPASEPGGVAGQAPQHPLPASSGVALATFVKGEVWLVRTGQKTPLVSESRILADDLIETGAGGKARLVFLVDPAKGMKMIPPSTRFEVSAFLGQKTDASLVILAPEILEALSRTTEGESVVNISRGAGRKRLLFPLGAVHGDVGEMFWAPVEGATSYRVTVNCVAKGIKKEFETPGPFLTEPVAVFEPGVTWMVTLTGWRESQQVFSQSGLFYFPGKVDASFDERLREAERSLAEPGDPTVHLVKGILFLKHRFFGNALQQFRRFARETGKTGLLNEHLRAALDGLNFSREEAGAIRWERLFAR